MFEIFANLILTISFKKVIATEQKLPNVSTANGTIDALEREPLAHAFSWLYTYYIIYIKCSLTHILYKFLLLPFINISNQKY